MRASRRQLSPPSRPRRGPGSATSTIRPSPHSLPLLGALAAETQRVTLGPLVARVSLLPKPVLVHGLVTLHRVLEGRFVAGLGTGDSANRAENEAYGLGFGSVAERVSE